MQVFDAAVKAQLPRLALFTVAASVAYAVLVDQGQLTAGPAVFHELFHDARHLLGVPCH